MLVPSLSILAKVATVITHAMTRTMWASIGVTITATSKDQEKEVHTLLPHRRLRLDTH